MIRVVLLFLVLSIFASLVIVGFQKMTGKQALALTKVIGLAIISASIGIVLMFGLVILF
jgi:hypothetical protein